MPRSSRHKSHRSHKHSSIDATEVSDSEDDGSSRDRRLRLVEAGPGSGARVSMCVEAEKMKSSSSLQPSMEKDKGGSENGDFSSGRKRKERGEDSATPDRWNGSGKDDGLPEKGSKEEVFGPVNPEKADKLRLLTVESKSRSSRRRDGSTERYGESGSRTDSVKRRSEKEHTRRDYGDDKERDRERLSEREKDKERVSERDRKVQDSRHVRSDDVECRSQRSRSGVVEVDWKAKKDSTESQARDDLHNVESEKDPEKFMTKRRYSSGGIDKGLDDGRNSDDKRLSSRDDHIKNGSHKVEGHKEERYKDDRYRDKYYKDLDRDQRHRDIRHREERSSRDYICDRLESKSVRDRDKPFESNRKSRLHGSDRELSPHVDDHGIKSRDSRVQKKAYDENDGHYGLKKVNAKESRSDLDKDASNSSKFDYRHQGKVDYSVTNTLSRSSSSPKTHNSKEQIRRGLKQAEYTPGEPVYDDRARPTEDQDRLSVVHERVPEAHSSEKTHRRDRINSDDREGQLFLENPNMHNNFQADLQITEHVSVSQSPFKRTSYFPGSSPGHHFPQTPMRLGMDNPTPYEDEMRNISGDHRSNSRYRSSDPNMERGKGVIWKNGPTWPAPLPNGFIPFQHGPAPGFHSAIQHFPPPSLFGARPYMEMNQTGISYHMHEVTDRFPSQGHPFGWHHPIDDSCPPQMHGWDGGSSLFGDKSQVYVRPDWNRNMHLIGGRGWELNAEMWRGHNSNMAEFSSPQELADESRGAYPCLDPNSEVDHFRHALDDAAQVKQLNGPPDNKSIEGALETKLKKVSRPHKMFKGDSQNLCNYFAKIEISADLIHPELYEEIKVLLTSVNSTGIYNISKDEDAMNNKIQNSAKFSNLRSSLLPTAADATFQRAMSVYEKQKYGRLAKPPAVALCSKEVNVSEASAAYGMRVVSSSVPKEPLTANACSTIDMEMLDTNKCATNLMGEEDLKSSTVNANSSPIHVEVEEVKNSGDTSKKQFDLNSDVLVESSQACETIIPVCKVNLIRMHNPHESTH